MERRRLPGQSRRGRDPDAGPHRGHCRHLRRHDHEPAVPEGHGARLRGREDQELRRDALRPAGGGCVRERGQARRHPDRRAGARRGIVTLAFLLIAATATAQAPCAPADDANRQGMSRMLAGDLPKALASFNEALRLDASLEQARLNRGIAVLRAGQTAKAMAGRGALANGEHPRVRGDAAYHLALALDRLGRTAEAETWVDRALKLDNKLDAALLFAGILREKRGDLQG